MRHALKAVGLAVLLFACGGVGRVPYESDGAAPETAGELDAYDPLDNAESPSETVGVPEICVPNCAGRECGDDGCGNVCGMCLPGVSCLADGTCEPCIPDCQGKWCGSDECGGSCGECPQDQKCTVSGMCSFVEDPCLDKECGNWDGVWCGDCPCLGCHPGFCECILDTGLCEECGDHDGQGCAAIFDCLNGCPDGDTGCQQNCIDSASIDDQMAFNNLYQCWIDVGLWICWDLCPEDAESRYDCPPEGQECIEEALAMCQAETDACFPSGTD